MKNRLSYILFSFFFSLSISGCGDDLAAPETEDELVPITFSSDIITNTGMDVQTKAETETDFPNSGNIAILAAKGNSDEIKATDWLQKNLLLNHKEATAGTKNTDSYPVTINAGTQYWSFNPAEYLTFAAYSPMAGNALSIIDTDNKTLKVDIGTDKTFPDLLYTTPVGPYNKEDGKSAISLGEFQHAMSKLVVKVIPVDKDGTIIKDENLARINVKITSLMIDTKVTSGTFSFTSADPEWTPGSVQANYRTVYTLVNSETTLPYSSAAEYYMLPGTQANSRIYLKIKDVVDTEYTELTIDQFKLSSTAATLEAGKTTTLTIKLKVIDIETGEDPATTLEGTLTDWVYKGNSNVEIQ